MSTITPQQAADIRAYLDTHYLPVGLGTEEAACSMAAINLTLSGKLTDEIPDCMSLVVGRWLTITQDRLDDAARNSVAWKSLLPLAAGTGRRHEPARLAIVTEAMWQALAWAQPAADRDGYGKEWARLLTARTTAAAVAASAAIAAASSEAAALAADYAADYAAAAAADAADDAAEAAEAAEAAAGAAGYAAAYAAASEYDSWAIKTLRRLVT